MGRRDHRTTAYLGQVRAAVPLILTCTNVPAGDRTGTLCFWLVLRAVQGHAQSAQNFTAVQPDFGKLQFISVT